ncbi:MAG: hypothetical protein QOE45_511 [Frankiaceae bacterium]|nr:hypothetical protein [Frankiaceae bacterium]
MSGLRTALAATALGATALAGPAAAAPRVTVLPWTTGLDPAGQALTVRGSGFDPTANGGVGIYVVFGPKGADYSTNADRYEAAKWVRTAAFGGAGQSELRSDGTFEVTLPGLKAKYLDANDRLVDCYRDGCQVMTFTAHGIPDRGNDTFTPVSFATGKPAPVGRAVVPYRPGATPRAGATATPAAAQRATGGPPVGSPAPSAAAVVPTGTVSPTASGTPAAEPDIAAPPPLRRSSTAPVAASVVVGLAGGAGATYALRRRSVRRAS